MHVSAQCGQFISAWEGIKDGDPNTLNYDPYMDIVGIWTIGYGHVLTEAGRQLTGQKDRARAFAQFPGGITKARAVEMLTADMRRFEAGVNAVVRPDATQNQFDALVSFNFNTGGLAASTLARLHREGMAVGPLPGPVEIRALADEVRAGKLKSPTSIRDAFAVWSKAKGAFVGGLFCRRLSEFALYSGRTAAEANDFGAQVRAVIAH